MSTLDEALGALREAPRWFLYLLTWDSTTAKYAKEPCALDGSRRPIDASKPENWNTYAAARAALEALPSTPERCYTLGFWLTADCGYWFFDLDKVSPGDGSLTEHAQAMVRMFPGALLEWSSSLRGLHIIGRTAGGIPPHRNRAIDGLSYEFYSAGRGIAFGLSGHATGSADTCHDVSVHQVVSSYFPKQETAAAGPATEWNGPQDDDELIRRMLAARPSAEAAFGGKVLLRQLWEGLCDKNSEHDAALASHLAFWTGRDAERIARLMWRSGMVREKWRAHRTYLQTTIQNACARCSNVYQEARQLPPLPSQKLAQLIRSADDLLAETHAPVQWAIKDILPEGVTLLAGDPKQGKSFLVLKWCMAVAAGMPIWNSRGPEIAGDVLYIALEDSDRRMKRRIEKLRPAFHGARLSRFFYATEWPRANDGVEKIRDFLRERPECRLVVIDTLAAFRESDPGRKGAYQFDYDSVRALSDLSKEFTCALLLIHHTRKASAGDGGVNHRVSGTNGLAGGVSNVFVLERSCSQNVTAVLHVNGRDIEHPCELALQLNDGNWGCVGDASEVARSQQRNAVLEALVTLKGCGTAREIHTAMGSAEKLGTLQVRLSRMVKAGELELNGGIYTRVDSSNKLLPMPTPGVSI